MNVEQLLSELCCLIEKFEVEVTLYGQKTTLTSADLGLLCAALNGLTDRVNLDTINHAQRVIVPESSIGALLGALKILWSNNPKKSISHEPQERKGSWEYVLLRETYFRAGCIYNNKIVVAGSYGEIMYLDGTSWTPINSVNSKAINSLHQTKNGIFAGGNQGQILRFNGYIWRTIKTDNCEGIYSICSTKDLVVAVGSGGTIVRHTNSTWEHVTSGTTNWLSGIWAADNQHFFIVGFGGTFLQYDGKETLQKKSSRTTSHLTSIWGVDRQSIFIVGEKGIILYYDGETVVQMSSPTRNTLRSVHGRTYNDVYAVGDNGTILHFDGVEWRLVESNTNKDLHCVFGYEKIVIAGDELVLIESAK